MPSITAYPRTIEQIGGGNHQVFENLNNLKNGNNTYSRTKKLAGKTGTKKRPAALIFTNFDFSDIPVGADITNIIVEYAHQKLDDVKDKYPSIAAPTISLRKSGVTQDLVTETGATPIKTLTEKNKQFNGKHKMEVAVVAQTTTQTTGGITTKVPKVTETVINYTIPSRTRIQNSEFGVNILYPANTSANTGYLQLKYVRIRIVYKVSKYKLKVVKGGKDDIYAGLDQAFTFELTNVNLTHYLTKVIITLPQGTTIQQVNGPGEFMEWDPPLNQWIWKLPSFEYAGVIVGTLSLQLVLRFTEGSKVITAKENLTKVSSESRFTVYPQKIYSRTTESLFEAENTIYAFANEQFTLPLKLPTEFLESTDLTAIYLFNDKQMQINGIDRPADGSMAISLSEFDEEGFAYIPCICPSDGEYLIAMNTTLETPENPSFLLRISAPMYRQMEVAILQLSDEEIDRLGDGEVYTAIADIKLNTEQAYYYNDYFRNYRLGVVNSIPESDDKLEILEACTHFSEGITTINHWEEKTVDFIYDEDYPVYIIITGDAINALYFDYLSMNFTHPNLIPVDDEYTPESCILPVPIENIREDGIATVSIPAQQITNPIICTDFEVDEDFGTNEDYAIRGILLQIDCESNGQVVANAKLKSPNGHIGMQSTTITANENTFYIGGEYDLWGFKISDMEQLKNWIVELTFSNTYGNNETDIADIEIDSIHLIAYYLKLPKENVQQIFIDGENLEWYGVFIQNWDMVSGIKTDVKYLNVDGTDINDANNQTIKEKEITIEFDVDGCDLAESTALLRQVTKLLTNKRDDLNKPIPNTITSSFEPDVYYEYILEDGIDSEVNISGYECKAKLTVPAGTSYAVEDTVTNATGVVDSIARVNPIIVVIPQSETIELLEEYSEQKFQAGRSDWIGKYVEIDCEDRIVWLRDEEDDEPTNISGSADFNVDWFSLDGAYNFLATGCIIQTVTFTERG